MAYAVLWVYVEMAASEDPQACVIALQMMAKGTFSKAVFLVAFLSWRFRSRPGCYFLGPVMDTCLNPVTVAEAQNVPGGYAVHVCSTQRPLTGIH